MANYFDSLAKSWDSNPDKRIRAEATANKIKQIDFPSTQSLVDFGSGTGLLGVQLLDTFSHIILADSSCQMLEVADEKITAENISNICTQRVQTLAEITTQHSAIVTLMTLHHIDNIDQFFSDAFRTLEQEGILIIADLYKEDGSFHKHHPSYSGHNGFETDKLTAIAKNAGFNVLSIEKYFDIWKENFEGVKVPYPLFLFVAKKSIK